MLSFNIHQVDIQAPDQGLAQALAAKIDGKTKPLGALGRLEKLALQIGLIQATLSPKLSRPVVLVFAGDHGIAESGVSPYPQSVTQQMVLNFLNGGAGINVFAHQTGMQLRVIDAGVNHDFGEVDGLTSAKVERGTRNFLHEPAMMAQQCTDALQRGVELAQAEIEVATLNATELRVFAAVSGGEPVGPASSMLKCAGSEVQQAITELAVEAVGHYATPFVADTWAQTNEARPGPDYAAPAAPSYLNYRKASIYAGSNEIQRNIMAKLVLGL